MVDGNPAWIISAVVAANTSGMNTDAKTPARTSLLQANISAPRYFIRTRTTSLFTTCGEGRSTGFAAETQLMFSRLGSLRRLGNRRNKAEIES
jgi:hypothetical protein